MKKQLEDMDVIDNFLFNEITSDDNIGESACREMIGTLLQKKIGRVRIIPQRNLTPGHPDYRGIIMDVEVLEDIDNEGDESAPNMNIYDLEPHRKPKQLEDLPRRIRFYQAKIDHRRLKSGEKHFGRLPNLYIIFVLDYDPFGFDQVCYTIDNACKEVPELNYEDGVVIKYFNTTGTQGGNEAINNMLHFIQHSTSENAVDDATRRVYDYVKIVKTQEDTVMRYMSWEEYFEDDIKEAKEEAVKEARQVGLAQGHAEGLKQGHAEGLKQGLEQGLAEGKAQLIQQMISNGKSAKEIAEFVGMDMEAIKKMIKD